MKFVSKKGILRIAIDRAENMETWTLYGSLSGEMVNEFAVTWKNTRTERMGREWVIDLTEVISIDERGEQMLMQVMRTGARFVVRGVYSTNLVKTLSARCKQGE